MAQNLYGSIDFSKLLEEAKKGNKAFTRAANGKVYCNISVWINDEKDKYGNDASIQTSFKDATKEERLYVGNLTISEVKTQQLEPGAADIPDDDDLPF